MSGVGDRGVWVPFTVTSWLVKPHPYASCEVRGNSSQALSFGGSREHHGTDECGDEDPGTSFCLCMG